MKIVEKFTLSDYTVEKSVPSQIVKNHKHKIDIGYNCPACGLLLALLEHGHSRTCACGIKHEVYGNLLQLTKETP